MVKRLIIIGILIAILGGGAVTLLLWHIRDSLPNLTSLKDYQPLLVSEVFDRKGKKVGEFYKERRVLIPYERIPKLVVNAFVAAEDDQFFKHKGVNYLAMMRAAFANFRAGRNVQGASTITQQVAKTLLLTPEKTFDRKVKEIFLAQKMEDNLSKEEILYLYLNQIYFGQGAYGIESAAEVYFRKHASELNAAEAGILAGLPKAPTAYSPVHNPSRAKERQVYVLGRMQDLGMITKDEQKKFVDMPVRVFTQDEFPDSEFHYLETIRQLLVPVIGEAELLENGVQVYASMDAGMQEHAQKSLDVGLRELDKRQGYRGPLAHLDNLKDIEKTLDKYAAETTVRESRARIIEKSGKFTDIDPLEILHPQTLTKAVVTDVGETKVMVRFAKFDGVIPFETMKWARKPNPDRKSEWDPLRKPSQALKAGDIVWVRIVENTGKLWTVHLEQEPTVDGALISLDQNTQDVLALVGGRDFNQSKFNRALQAARQTGSAFKPLVYLSALDSGFNPSTMLVDSPVVFEETIEKKPEDKKDKKATKPKNGSAAATATATEGEDEEIRIWKPANHSKSFNGDITVRNALAQSLNVPAVKVIEQVGVQKVIDYARRLGIFSPLNRDFTLALGSSSLTLYELTKAFSEIGRMGKRMRPQIISKVVNHHGDQISGPITLDQKFSKELGELDQAADAGRATYLEKVKSEGADAKPSPFYFDDPDQLVKPQTAYIMTSLMKAVIEEPLGTGGHARELGYETAGKTGTTNSYDDAWFIGFTPLQATGVWVGFDQEKTLGKGEVGGKSALPIWLDYMKFSHQNLPKETFSVPDGIVFAKIDAETGRLATTRSKRTVRQAFIDGTEPQSDRLQEDSDKDYLREDLVQ